MQASSLQNRSWLYKSWSISFAASQILLQSTQIFTQNHYQFYLEVIWSDFCFSGLWNHILEELFSSSHYKITPAYVFVRLKNGGSIRKRMEVYEEDVLCIRNVAVALNYVGENTGKHFSEGWGTEPGKTFKLFGLFWQNKMPASTKISCSPGIQGCRAGLWCRKLCYSVNNGNLNKPRDIKGICIYELTLLWLLCY